MKQTQTDIVIRDTAKRLFARNGYEGVSMRILSKESGVGLSSIYHFFKDKDVLLKAVYDDTNAYLGTERRKLPYQPKAKNMLEQLINFQFDHATDVVYVLKYYLSFREDFAALPDKTLPAKSIQHVEEVIRRGIETGEYAVSHDDIRAKAKVLTHTINGYLLEYYPHAPNKNERLEIIDDVVSFSMAGLAK